MIGENDVALIFENGDFDTEAIFDTESGDVSVQGWFTDSSDATVMYNVEIEAVKASLMCPTSEIDGIVRRGQLAFINDEFYTIEKIEDNGTGVSVLWLNEMSWHVPKLLGSVVVSTSLATKQSLYTVPSGRSAVVMIGEFRSASATLAGMTATMSVGFNAAANDWATGIDLTGLTAASKVAALQVNGVTVIGSAGETFGAIFSNTLTNQTLTIDVWGYTF